MLVRPASALALPAPLPLPPSESLLHAVAPSDTAIATATSAVVFLFCMLRKAPLASAVRHCRVYLPRGRVRHAARPPSRLKASTVMKIAMPGGMTMNIGSTS